MKDSKGIKKKILIVDDEENIRELVVSTIENPTYQVLEASDGKMALEIARREKPDLIFLDVKMPRMDGLEVCRALKSNPETSSITIVMLTAMTQEEDIRLGIEAGAEGYFTKPFSPTALLDKINEVLG